MNRALFNRRARQLHLWLGLAIGAQVGLWLISGLFMTWFPIEEVRGEHLRTEMEPAAFTNISDLLTPDAILEKSEVAADSLSLHFLLEKPVWRVSGDGKRKLVDATTGDIISPLSEEMAIALAQSSYSGDGAIVSSTFLTEPPREYGRPGPVWKVNFGPDHAASFYVDASMGEVRAVRTTLWRVFDFMWGLHIMDWSTRENFNSWWIKMTASLAIVFFFAGLCLSILRVMSWIGQKSRRTPAP